MNPNPTLRPSRRPDGPAARSLALRLTLTLTLAVAGCAPAGPTARAGAKSAAPLSPTSPEALESYDPYEGPPLPGGTPARTRSAAPAVADLDAPPEDRPGQGVSGDVLTAPEPAETPTPAAPGGASGRPTAQWLPGKAGREVASPFTGKRVDVTGLPPGSEAYDPYTHEVFIVPTK